MSKEEMLVTLQLMTDLGLTVDKLEKDISSTDNILIVLYDTGRIISVAKEMAKLAKQLKESISMPGGI